MTENTEQNVNEAIDWIQKTGGSLQDFAVEQAPLYCREIVAWELWSNLCLVAGMTICLIMAGLLWRKLWSNFNKEGGGIADEPIAYGILVTLLGSIVCFCVFGNGVYGAVKAKVAPRIVIVEHLKEMSK
jgi:hypothetical protein